MTDLNVLTFEELPKSRAEEIDWEKDVKLMKENIAKIKRIMRKKKLTSLSAPAIGYNKRIFCIDFSDKEIKTFINPMILNADGMEMTREVCSSIPDKEFIRPRNTTIDIIYQRPDGTIKQTQFKGVAAAVMQHELDHLDAITLSDVGLEIDEDFDNASEEDKFAIIDMYVQSLRTQQELAEEKIKNDPVSNIMFETEKMVELIAQGRITVEPNKEEGKE